MIDAFKLAKQTRKANMKKHILSSSIFTIELLQVFQQHENEPLCQYTRADFIDLPGAEKLLEDRQKLVIMERQHPTKQILSLQDLLVSLSALNHVKDKKQIEEENKMKQVAKKTEIELADQKSFNIIKYNDSILNFLCNDVLGGNSFCVGIFCLQNGDPKANSISLKFLMQTNPQLPSA